jgi:hypothetical protein
MIHYKETIDRGFERNDLAGDSVWFNEFGYEWFITEKQLIKSKKGEIVANWMPDTKTIEVIRLVDGMVKARRPFSEIEEFEEFETFIRLWL